MRFLATLGAIAIGSSAYAAPANIWLACEINQATLCDSTACRPSKPKIKLYLGAYEIEGKSSTYYYRCDVAGTGCDNYEPLVDRRGAFTSFVLPENGVIARIGPGDTVTDIATLMDTVLISRGKCSLEPPPLIRLRPE